MYWQGDLPTEATVDKVDVEWGSIDANQIVQSR